MRNPLNLAVLLLCGAYLTHPYPSFAQTAPDQPTSLTQYPSTQSESSQADPQVPCQDFTAPVTLGGGKQVQAVGRTCQQPDGSLQVTLKTPGLPTQVYTMQAPQASQMLPEMSEQQPLQQAPPSQATYVYPFASPYAYFYPPPPPVFWSNPWVFGGFPFFAGGSVFFVHDHFRRRFDHRFFFTNHVIFKDHFHDRFFHHGFDGRRFHQGGFHGGVSHMSGGFGAGGGSHR
jgi:hypothetical protein